MCNNDMLERKQFHADHVSYQVELLQLFFIFFFHDGLIFSFIISAVTHDDTHILKHILGDKTRFLKNMNFILENTNELSVDMNHYV